MLHIDNHLSRAIYVGGEIFCFFCFVIIWQWLISNTFMIKCVVHISEYTIHRCGLQCRKLQHYHCLYCKSTLIRKRDFTNHLPACRKAQQRRGQKLSQQEAAMTQRVPTKRFCAPTLTPRENDILCFDIVRLRSCMMHFLVHYLSWQICIFSLTINFYHVALYNVHHFLFSFSIFTI